MTLQSKKLVVVCFTVLAMIVVASITYSESTPPKIRVSLPIQSLDGAPFIIAYQQNYFHDQEIDVELVHLQTSEGPLAVGSGQVDIGMIGVGRLLSPIEKGTPIKMLSLISNMTQHLFVRPDDSIKSLKDLEGKTVSLGNAVTTRMFLFRYILKKEGVDANKINFIDIEKMYLPMQLMGKKEIDAALIDEPAYVDTCKELGAVVLPEWSAKNYGRLPAGSTVSVNADFLKGNEENIHKFYKALIEANRYLKEHLDESAVIVTEYIKNGTNGAMDMKPDEFKKMINEGSVVYSLWDDPALVMEIARIAYDLGQIGRILSLDDLFDLRFKDSLESAQHEIYGIGDK